MVNRINNNESYLYNLNKNIPIDDLNNYFDLVREYQNDYLQDTYLLMDNLYEENASAIDSYSFFSYTRSYN